MICSLIIVLLTNYLALTHPNKMEWLKGNIGILLRVLWPCFLTQNYLPLIWSYAISTVLHLINRLPTPILHNLSPWELLFKAKPNLLHLKVFGCTCFPLLKPYNTHKFQPHTSPCVFLGYPPYSKGYRCLEPHSHWIYVTRYVLFNQHDFSALTQVSSLQSSAPPSNSPSPTLWLTFLLHSCSQSILQPSTQSNSTAHLFYSTCTETFTFTFSSTSFCRN